MRSAGGNAAWIGRRIIHIIDLRPFKGAADGSVQTTSNAASRLSLVAVDHCQLVGTVRLWNVTAGPGRDALLLGPLAVHPDHRNRGIGTALMRRAIARARLAGHGAILLVGDAAYYGRFGFSTVLTRDLWMPGEYERDRLLAVELKPGALAGARGPIRVRVTAVPKSDFNAAIAVKRGKRRAAIQRAA